MLKAPSHLFALDALLAIALETRMRRFLTQYPKDKHGVHHYSRAQFGLSPDEVATYFQAYVARFKPEPEVA